MNVQTTQQQAPAILAALKKIAQVDDEINRIEFSAARLPKVLINQRALLCIQIWKQRALGCNVDCKKWLAMTNRLAYDAGMVSEALMSKLLSLDAVGVGLGGEVRQARRAVVVRAKELMRDFDQLRARALHLVRSGLHSALDKAINIASEANHDTAIATPNLESVDIASATPMDTSAVDFDEVSETDSGLDTNMGTDQVAEESDQEDEEITSGPALNPSLRYHPRFEEQRVNGGVILSAHVPGVSQKDLECSLDTESRTLKVRGIRHVRTWMGDSYRWFEQEFSLPSSLTTNAENVQVRLTRATLQIFVPYAAPPVKSRAQKRYYQPSLQSFASPERLFASRRGGFGSFTPFGLAW